MKSKQTEYAGIDYGMGQSNVDLKTGIRYGVIHQNDVGQPWYDSSEPYYGKPELAECPNCIREFDVTCEWGDTVRCPRCGMTCDVELPDMCDPISHYYEDDEYSMECGEDGDIFITKSPYYTHAQFCSPCAPGAGYLMSPCPNGPMTYCLGHEWFEDGKAPYPVFDVETGARIEVE